MAYTLLGVGQAGAQQVPDAFTQEVLIKSSLMSFNDANVTGDYSVLHGLVAEEFAAEFSVERFAEVFGAFHEQGIDFKMIVAMDPVASADPEVHADGALILKGYFETEPSQVEYDLSYVLKDEGWKLIGINVDIGEGE